MKSLKHRDQFGTCSRRWKDERKKNNPDEIIKLWQERLPRGWTRELWRGEDGYRKRSDHRGEQITESKLFAGQHKHFQLFWPDSQRKRKVSINAIYYNMPLANQHSGQVIADAFGILRVGEKARPLFIEVKSTADNPWFALVENLQQIRLARACADRIKTFTESKSKLPVEPGVWGLILAPSAFYRRHSISLERCLSLLGELKRRTTARVAFGSSDTLDDGQFRLLPIIGCLVVRIFGSIRPSSVFWTLGAQVNSRRSRRFVEQLVSLREIGLRYPRGCPGSRA